MFQTFFGIAWNDGISVSFTTKAAVKSHDETWASAERKNMGPLNT